ncbi:sodium-independent anion transporter [Opitutaceae bacterium EW11]|nr:sodium-independent anion transporter [Opitutaceae bacterium EW11]
MALRIGEFQPRSFTLWGSGYSRQDALADLKAGATVGLIALPLALALGITSLPQSIAGAVPAAAIGVLTAVIGGFIVSLLGGSRVQIGGPTVAFIPVILLVLQQHGYIGLLVATMLAGGILIIMGISRLGNLVRYIPYPVTSGLTTGIAISVIVTLTPDFLGIPDGPAAPHEFVARVGWIAQHIPQINPLAAILGIACALLIYFWPRLGWQRLPGSVVALVVATLAVVFLHWQSLYGVTTVGTRSGANLLPDRLTLVSLSDLTVSRIRDLIVPATSIALLVAIDSLLSARVADTLINDRHDPNSELIAHGLANLLCPFLGGLPVSGAVARTSTNIRCGGRTPLAGMVHAAVLLVLVLALQRYLLFVPLSALAAVLLLVAYRRGEWHEFARLGQMTRSDGVVLVTSCVLTVFFGVVVAVEVAMVLAAILFIRRMADTTQVSLVTANDELETSEQVAHGKRIPDGVLVYRIFGPFFFGAAEKMEDALRRMERLPRVLIVRMQLVPAMDATALDTLETVLEKMRAAGGTVILSGPHRQPLQLLSKAGFVERIGRPNIRAHFDDALARAEELLEDMKVPKAEEARVRP